MISSRSKKNFQLKASKRSFSPKLPQQSCQGVTVQVLLKENTGSSIEEHCFGLGGCLVHTCGHSVSGNRDNLDPFEKCTWTDTATLASPVTPGRVEHVSRNFAGSICYAEAPCSVHTALYPLLSVTLSPEHDTFFLNVWRCFASSESGGVFLRVSVRRFVPVFCVLFSQFGIRGGGGWTCPSAMVLAVLGAVPRGPGTRDITAVGNYVGRPLGTSSESQQTEIVVHCMSSWPST